MKRNYLKLFVLVVLIVVINGCSTNSLENNKKELDNVSELNSPIPIQEIRELTEEEKKLSSKYLSQIDSKSIYHYDESTITSYKDINGYSIFISVSNEAKFDQNETTFILFMNQNKKIVDYAIFEKIENNVIDEINIYNNFGKFLTVSINNETNEMVSAEIFKSGAKGSWSNCVECAVSSCVNDGECAFMCGIVYKQCLGAIGVACLFSDLEC